MTAPTYDDENPSSMEISTKFYAHFQEKKNVIESGLEKLKSPSPSTNDVSSEIESLSHEVLALRRALIEVTPYLPGYDRGKCEQQLKTFEENLSQMRTPKTKFSFKRKPVPIPSVSASSETPSFQAQPKASLLNSSASATAVSFSGEKATLSLTSCSSLYLTRSSLIQSVNSPVFPSSSDLTLTDIKNCVINLLPESSSSENASEPFLLSITALYAKDLERVVLLLPPINGSILLYGVKNSVLVIGCRQFRIHDTTNTSIFLHVSSNPTIERSNGLCFSGYPEFLRLRYPQNREFFETPSNHFSVQDFDWIKADPSPNWRAAEYDSTQLRSIMQALENEKEIHNVDKLLAEVLSVNNSNIE